MPKGAADTAEPEEAIRCFGRDSDGSLSARNEERIGRNHQRAGGSRRRDTREDETETYCIVCPTREIGLTLPNAPQTFVLGNMADKICSARIVPSGLAGLAVAWPGSRRLPMDSCPGMDHRL